MKPRTALALGLAIVLAGFAAGPAVAASYDVPVSRNAMGRSVALLGETQKALGAKNWRALASAFSEFASIGETMAAMDPPMGSAEEWLTIWDGFSAAALAGKTAAAKKDLAAASEAFDKLNGLMQEGHRAFR